jgi:hypothetical protein
MATQFLISLLSYRQSVRGQGDGELRLHHGSVDLIEAWFTSTATALNVQKPVLSVNGSSFAALELYNGGVASGLRRSHLSTQGGKTALLSANDDGTVDIKKGLEMDHASGVVDFPNGLSIGGAGAGSIADNRGKSIITGPESRSNVAYGKLATPDQVTVTLATDGLLKILYQATWQESIAGAAGAAIFIGSNQLQAYNEGGAY